MMFFIFHHHQRLKLLGFLTYNYNSWDMSHAFLLLVCLVIKAICNEFHFQFGELCNLPGAKVITSLWCELFSECHSLDCSSTSYFLCDPEKGTYLLCASVSLCLKYKIIIFLTSKSCCETNFSINEVKHSGRYLTQSKHSVRNRYCHHWVRLMSSF